MMATAAKVTIAEVEHLVEVPANSIRIMVHTPSVYVKRIFEGAVLREENREAHGAHSSVTAIAGRDEWNFGWQHQR